MRLIFRFRKKVAILMLSIWLLNTLIPAVSYALTSGPSQPESRSFQPAGVSDMVDPFTGSFKYNIPLLDVDGYPVNLNYESGTGMDDEASWTGLGWNVNVGAINRQVRGIPDDMAGDIIKSDNYTKPKVTIGGRVTGKIEVAGLGKSLTASGSYSLGIFNDSYTGIGADVSVNAGISLGNPNGNGFTGGLGVGLASSTASGVDITPYASLSVKRGADDKTTEQAGISASLGYNTRSGMKGITLGASFDVSQTVKQGDLYFDEYNAIAADPDSKASTGFQSSGSLISYNTEPIQPNIQIPYKSRYGSFSIDLGGSLEIFFLGGGASGYKNVREVETEQLSNPAYGFMYAERGKNQKNAIMDFIREKENPIIPELPNLALPVHTPDIFTYTSQTGSGQFRLYRGGSGSFFDNEVSDDNASTTIGGDLGVGETFHAGVTFFQQNGTNTTRKWTSSNNYLSKGDFQDASNTNPNAQQVYFKVVGEKTTQDAAMVSKVHDTQPLEVSITNQTANAAFTNNSLDVLQKQNRQVNQTVVSYLTAQEASAGALDKMINSYPLNNASNFHPPANHHPIPSSTITRYDNNYRAKHHLSEITVTNESGKRMVYGIPVYNVSQTEYSFAIGAKGTEYDTVAGTQNQVKLSLNNPGTPSASINRNKGIDNYYHQQTQPAYASSFLLTAILSPDYVDRTGNGITDDDAGTAIKFNYSKMPNLYKWRTPFNNATLNRCLLADKDDDKASIVYGEKELWYPQSIETKTKIAYFITESRRDALGVTDFTGAKMDTNNRQKCLKEIRLYSKSDMTKPIKVVKFEYTYELCRHLPNNMDNPDGVMSTDTTKGGKLTLKKVYFEYQNSPKGANYPYTFSYNKTANGNQVYYGYMLTDRWGVYKAANDNALRLTNEEFPYTSQDIQGTDPTVKAKIDQNAALWHLSSIGLPTGGTINVSYESNDYAYVQNKRAMVMSGVQALIDVNGNVLDPSSSNYLYQAKGLQIKIPVLPASPGDATNWFKQNYLNGADYIYTKFSVKLSTPYSNSGGPAYDYDFIPCYSKVKSVAITGQYANVFLEDRSEGGVTANPIIFSAWQRIKDEYPRYAYPGFDTRVGSSSVGSTVTDAVMAVIHAIGNISELLQNFYQKASKNGFASTVQLNRSFVKVVKQDGHKLGGGVRVKKIQITDSWQSMAGNTNYQTANYGQSYSYTTVDNGITISSGVASYEPSVGNDENPLKQPVPYIQKIKGALDNYFDLEQPFGESFFPAPTVGYSKVTITDLDKNGIPDPSLRTGYTVDEFYTAKDFPVQVTVMPMSENENKPANSLSFLGATNIDELTMSQGYSIELNDMHGKPKAIRTLNQSGAEIASTVYYYNADTQGADEYKLKNVVNIVNPDGTITPNQVIGRDIDFFTDFREFESKNAGHSYDLGFDMVGLWIFSFPLPHIPNYDNSDYRLFRSACAVKVSQYYGIIDKVVKTENGSSITTQNMAFDGLTGEPVVTQTQNEFNSPIYSVNIPAYWVYNGMGGAYQNAGIVLQGLTTNANAELTNYAGYLNAGDEIVDISTGTRYWVVNDMATGGTVMSKKLIDEYGKHISGFAPSGLVKLTRSGYRNMLNSVTSSYVCLNNPVKANRLLLASNTDQTALKVINASTTTYNNSWPMDQHGIKQDSTVDHTGNSSIWDFSVPDSNRGSGGVMDVTTGSSYYEPALQYSLNEIGVWLKPVTNPRVGDTVTYLGNFYVNEGGEYYVGYSGDGNFRYQILGTVLPYYSNHYWCVDKITLITGENFISMQVVNTGGDYKGAMGLAVYASGIGGATLFTTGSLPTSGVPIPVYRYFVNPYVRGFLGNWRESGSKVFQQSRHYNLSPAVKGVDVKNAGYINNFSPFWYQGTSGWTTDSLGNRARWVKANTVTAYDQYGQQLENKDALGRFSSAAFDFNGELPAAVASNALNREIYAGSFEDSFFTPGIGLNVPRQNDFKQTGTNNDIKQFATNTYSHSGNYSVALPTGGLTMVTSIHSKLLRTDSILAVNNYGEYSTLGGAGHYPNGFEPYTGKKYLFDVWVKDNNPTDKSVNLTLTMKTTAIPLTCKALVEDWKLLEGTLDLSTLGSDTTLTLALTSASSNIYLDDLRIHPFDAQMKSYVYDDQTMRLMAEIDENGFATFYEYDDEGLLIRVKKETERGIMTIKESRSSYKKHSLQ